MLQQLVEIGELVLVGLTARTNNHSEMNPQIAKIPALYSSYWQVMGAIQNQKYHGVAYAVYTDYESDEGGDYTYFIGAVVDSLASQDLEKFSTITIPASSYQKFTTDSGAMPEVVISAWQKIWQMTAKDFGGRRKYIADFEVYDKRAIDSNSTIIDIYIGIDSLI